MTTVKARKRRTGQWTVEAVRGLGVVTDLDTACSILDIGRTMGRQLARDGAFPVPVLRAGALYKVPVAGLLVALRISDIDEAGALTPAHVTTADENGPRREPESHIRAV